MAYTLLRKVYTVVGWASTHRKRRRWTTRSGPACRPASRRPGVCGRGPTRGRGPRLSLERIVAAAVRVAAADGLQAVSMSRVAADLGVSTMSLYRYVAAKDELLALMADLAFEAPPGAERAGRGLARGAVSAGRGRSWPCTAATPGCCASPSAARRSPPTQVAWLERGLDCLRDTGLREDEKLSVILLLTGYVRNQATLEADIAAAQAAGHRRAGPGDDGLLRAHAGQADRPGAVPGPARGDRGRRVRARRTSRTASSASAWSGCWTGSRP